MARACGLTYHRRMRNHRSLVLAVVALVVLPACGTTTITPWKVADTACDIVRTAAVACQLVPSSSGGESSP